MRERTPDYGRSTGHYNVIDSFRVYTKGGIHMSLLHQDVIMNIKKICYRLMGKYHLFCLIRKANPYRRMAKAIDTNHVAPNLVNREIKRDPRKILLTDIGFQEAVAAPSKKRDSALRTVSRKPDLALVSHPSVALSSKSVKRNQYTTPDVIYTGGH